MPGLNIQLNAPANDALIVGSAPPAADRVATLLRAGVNVTVVAPELDDALRRHAESGRIGWRARGFDPDDVIGAVLVLAASDDPAVNREVREAAARHRRLCNEVHGDTGDFSLLPDPAESRAHDPDLDPWRHARVCLVGAGPGDPGLLTRVGDRALRTAEVVLYDRLVSDETLALAPPTAERIFVGKQRNRHHCPQEAINARMIELARAGRRVVRLKGGDPFVFGRGGEELTELTAAGIACHAIPGITAGSGCATYADIPLTHRDHAHSCQFITAYGKDGESDHDWAALVRSRHTLVVYMGLAALRDLCPKLVDHGLPADTPAALIERGTTPDQRVLTGTVTSLPERAQQEDLQSPAVLIVGEVVRVRERLEALRAVAAAEPAAAQA
ncbi:MAG: uroporphyrinogen-III C-methyltransferase [Halofilum sp. (in: g-proteobacteria)]|nr:uroporphyrinogen-III C-methyltransferase [Halofilum sp. (in: g-proteobacteria)]